MCAGATPVSTTQVKQENCNIALLRMIHIGAKKKFHWLRSLSLVNTARKGFEAEFKMYGSNGTSLSSSHAPLWYSEYRIQ